MKYTIALLIIFILISELTPQTNRGQSGYVKLNIKFPPPDTTAPVITFELPRIMENYPYYSRDSIYTLNCIIKDDSKKVKVVLNDIDLGFIAPGNNVLKVNLKTGENIMKFAFSDRANNITKKELTLFYDPKADVTPPILKLNPPYTELSRGIQIVPKELFDSLITITGKFSDQSKILGVWVNGIPVDSIFPNRFYHAFHNETPDTIDLVIADIYGNLATYTAQFQDPPEMLLGEELTDISYHALIITINSYKDPKINDLDGPIKDGQNLASVLQESYNFDKKNIKALKNATRTQIITAFDEYKRKLNESCNLLIFYAGHGKLDEETETGYWLPSDANYDNTANWIQNSSIRDYIKAIKTQHTLVISDACFSGSLLRDFFPEAEKSINEIYKVKSRKAIISGIEATPDKSVFVEYLIKSLKSIDRPYFPAQTLFNHLKEPVINNSKTNQIPEYKAIPNTGDEGMKGDFIFKKKLNNPEKR